jgi:D-glycero-alpha-D-manno-heptose-7-phosphate kinase
MTAEGLAADAVRIEREVLQEAGGWQDQYFAAYGGLQRFDFGPDGSVRLTRVETGPGVMAGLESSMRMYFTGMIRDSAEVMLARAAESPSHTPAMLRILDLVDEAEKLLRNRWDATAFGRLLDEAWRLKRTLSAAVSSPRIDELYETACRAGATGGKLLGAGGGGFLLLCVPPERQGDVAAALPGLYEVPLRSSLDGATVVYQAAT